MRQGVNAGTPARYSRWGVRLAKMVLFAGLLVGVPTAGLSQQSGVKPDQDNGPVKTPEKQKTQKEERFRVQVTPDQGTPFISLVAKDIPAKQVAAELQRQLNVPIVLSPLMKTQSLDIKFENLPLEAAFAQLATQTKIDYAMHGGGDGVAPEKKLLAIYLLGYNETPPQRGPYAANESHGLIVVTYVAETEEEQKQYDETKKKDIQVSVKDNRFTVKVHKQYLTDVLEEIGIKAEIPFSILTTNANLKEMNEVVEDWDIKDSSLEDITRIWFPSNIRLYWRTDVQSGVSRPLRITLEPNTDAQAQQNVKP